jgi:ABC-type transporter Mla subunit MlaD
LENARLAGERLPGTVLQVQGLVLDVRHTVQEIQGAAADLRGIESHTAPDIESAIANVRHIADNLAKTSDRLDHFVADNEPGMSRFTHQSLPELEQLLRESRQAARDFRDLSRSLKQDPSQLIYEPNYRGVEVAK